MKRVLTLMFASSFFLHLSTAAFGQGKGNIPATPRIDHDRDLSHDTSHPKTDGQDHNDANFEARIERNAALKSKIESMLPSGEDLKTAATGFKNEGRFIAALHVSRNLGIPFDQLKAKMVSSNPPMSLGQAIHALKPSMSENDIDKATEKAEKEAKVDERTKPATKPLT